MRKLFRKFGVAPRALIIDKLKSYAAANKDMGLRFEHRQHKGLSNRAENSNQPKRVRSSDGHATLQIGAPTTTIRMHDQVAKLSHRCRYNVSAAEKRANRNQAFATWGGVTCANSFGIQAA